MSSKHSYIQGIIIPLVGHETMGSQIEWHSCCGQGSEALLHTSTIPLTIMSCKENQMQIEWHNCPWSNNIWEHVARGL